MREESSLVNTGANTELALEKTHSHDVASTVDSEAPTATQAWIAHDNLRPSDVQDTLNVQPVLAGSDDDLTRPPDSGIYYGPTCQLHVSSPSDVVRDPPHTIRQRPEVQIDPNSMQLKTALLKSYCDFQAQTVALIHRENFLAHRETGQRTQHYSRFLENSLMACSSRLSTSPAVRALGSSYAKLAKSDLVAELEDPNITTLQGLLMLSDYEMTAGRDRAGWVYCGKVIPCKILCCCCSSNALAVRHRLQADLRPWSPRNTIIRRRRGRG
jgi:hypothetical protein